MTWEVKKLNLKRNGNFIGKLSALNFNLRNFVLRANETFLDLMNQRLAQNARANFDDQAFRNLRTKKGKHSQTT